jgi:hypothetical protein
MAARARDVFAKAGLYDKKKGRGELRLTLTSFGRWTYNDLFRSYLVETGFIFILPSTLQVNYLLSADFAVSSGTMHVDTEAANKTTFHILMAPLYPFLSPGRRENQLIGQMLWRSATDVYTLLKSAGGVAAAMPPTEEEKARRTLSGPPLEPDRTWLPGKQDGEPETVQPETPDKTWVVPGKDASGPQKPAVTPAKADKTWAVNTPAAASAQAAQPAAVPAAQPEVKPAAPAAKPAAPAPAAQPEDGMQDD